MTETTTDNRPIVPGVADTLAPILAKLPAAARAEFTQGRKAAADRAQLTADELAARAAQDQAAEAIRVRRELLADRAERRWAMWCHQVPRHYADPRADCDRRDAKPFEFWLSRLDDMQQPEAIAAWLRGDTPTLVLVGYTGTGKTRAAIAAGYAAAAAGVHVRYTSQLDYLRLLRPGGSDDPGRVRWNAANTSLLILDDVGAETEIASEFTRQEVCALLDERLREGRRQIVTTNVEDPPELAAMFGDRIVSRLMGGALVLPFEGGDRRMVPASW